MSQNTKPAPTAGVLLIGDEILSGRTKDKNLGYIADFLTVRGIDLMEARVVADDQGDIVAALNALRARYSYVFTTGGIGPTHDDITADAVAAAFGVPIDHDPRAVALLEEFFASIGREPTGARMRMARVPQGGDLIANLVSVAPGIHIGNVFVMAGVPKIMQAMLEEVSPLLETGALVLSHTIEVHIGEGDLGGPLREIQERHDDVTIGSYPFETGTGFGSNIVVRTRDKIALERAVADVEKAIATLQSKPASEPWI